jgi:tyrosine-protein kinase Etk/Wzc
MIKETHTQKSLRDHCEVIVRRRWYLIVPLVSIMFLTAAISIFVPSVYEAHALLRVNDISMLEPIMRNGERPTGSNDAKTQVEALVKLTTSWPKLVSLIQEFYPGSASVSSSAMENEVDSVKKRIAVIVKDRDVVDIAYQDTDPARAQKVANRIMQEFINESARSKKEQARNAISFINEQLKIYRQKLESSEKGFSIRKIEEDLRIAGDRRQVLESRLESMRAAAPSRVSVEQNPALGRLQTQLADMEMELSRLMMDATAEHPRVIALKQDIMRVKGMISDEIKKSSVRRDIASSDPAYQQTEQELRQLNLEIAYLEKRQNELQGAESDAELSDGVTGALETGQGVDEDIYRMLLKQIESIYVADRLTDSEKGSAFSVVEYARLPVTPVKPNKLAIAIGGLFIGLLAGLGTVFLMEYMDRSFRTSDDAKKYLKMQFLGSVSKIVLEGSGKLSAWNVMNNNFKAYLQKKRLFSGLRFVTPHIAHAVMNTGVAPQVVMHHEPKSAVAEEYRILRTNVHGLNFENVIKTVMTTSTVRGEGKSTTGTNLAIAVADTGKKTLLIDCDMRRGTVHELLNLPQTPGLAEVLSHGSSMENALKTCCVRNLTVMTSGSRPTNPSELLGSSAMERLIDTLRPRFDMIIVDAPPVLNLPDACILGKHVDGVLFIVQAERTQREDVLRAQSMLLQAHGNIVGFVLTNVQYHIPKYVYDYLYGT